MWDAQLLALLAPRYSSLLYEYAPAIISKLLARVLALKPFINLFILDLSLLS